MPITISKIDLPTTQELRKYSAALLVSTCLGVGLSSDTRNTQNQDNSPDVTSCEATLDYTNKSDGYFDKRTIKLTGDACAEIVASNKGSPRITPSKLGDGGSCKMTIEISAEGPEFTREETTTLSGGLCRGVVEALTNKR